VVKTLGWMVVGSRGWMVEAGWVLIEAGWVPDRGWEGWTVVGRGGWGVDAGWV